MNTPNTTKPSNYPHREEMWSSILVSISKLMKEPHLVTSEDLQELDTYLANSVSDVKRGKRRGLARHGTLRPTLSAVPCKSCLHLPSFRGLCPCRAEGCPCG